jgi:hypothetical protein
MSDGNEDTKKIDERTQDPVRLVRGVLTAAQV